MARSAARSIAEVLPEAVATAVIDLITGDLLWAPERIGKPRPGDLAGLWVTRRGTFRIVYEMDHENHQIVLLRAEHRGAIYRSR